MKVTFTALRRWSTKEKKRLRKLLHNFEWEYKHFLDVFPVSDHHFLRLFLFKKKFFLLSLKLVTMSGATSDQLHRSTLSVYLVSLYCLLVLYTLVSVPGVDKL